MHPRLVSPPTRGRVEARAGGTDVLDIRMLRMASPRLLKKIEEVGVRNLKDMTTTPRPILQFLGASVSSST